MAEIILVQMAEFCQQIQSNILAVVGIQIAFDGSTFPAGVLGRHQFKSRICDTPQLEHQDLQHMSADDIVAFLFFVKFPEQCLEIKEQVGIPPTAVQNLKILMITKRKAHTVNTKGQII